MRREFLAGVLQPREGEGRIKRVMFWSEPDVPRYDFWTGEEWILRLSLDKVRLSRLNDGAPLLKNHEYSRPVENVMGVVERAWIEGTNAYADVRFADTEDVTPIWEKVEQGIIQNVSMEATIDDFEDVTPEDEKKKKKSKRILSATGWEVEAIAIVPVGADPNAGFMSPMSLAVPVDPAPAISMPDLKHRLTVRAARLRLL